MKNKNTLGIVSLVLGIIALIFSIVVVISVPLAITAVILGIVALSKKEKKVMPIVGIVLSSISVIICILFFTVIIGLFTKVTDDPNFEEKIKSGIVELYNGVSEGITSDLNIEDKLKGNEWMASDNSLLQLNDNGTYYWYQNQNDKSDNYYTGTYNVYIGDIALDKIDSKYGVNENALENNTSILRTDIYYLELNKISTVVNGEKTFNTQTTPYAIFFYNASSDSCEGMNLTTQNLVSFTKLY